MDGSYNGRTRLTSPIKGFLLKGLFLDVPVTGYRDKAAIVASLNEWMNNEKENERKEKNEKKKYK